MNAGRHTNPTTRCILFSSNTYQTHTTNSHPALIILSKHPSSTTYIFPKPTSRPWRELQERKSQDIPLHTSDDASASLAAQIVEEHLLQDQLASAVELSKRCRSWWARGCLVLGLDVALRLEVDGLVEMGNRMLGE